MSKVLFVGAVWFGLMCAATPAVAQNARERQMMADLRMLQEQTQQLQTMLQSTIVTLTDSLKSINSRIDEQTNASRKAFADSKLIVDQLGSDLRVVRERVDETNVRIGSMSQELEALRLSIPPAPQQTFVPPVTDPDAPPAAAVPGTPQIPAPASPTIAVSPQRMFDTAWTDYTAGQWMLCIEGFDQYIRTFPRSEQADDAQYYAGECYTAENKHTEAVDAYNRTITNYPKGDYVPLAYYKRGLAFERLGQRDRARESWEFLIKTFPDHEAARLAKQRLR
jgi:tol-pal system protein YbgF